MKPLTPMKAIRAKCLDCSCGSFQEVRECPVIKCPLYAYRHGHRPKTTNIIADESNFINRNVDPTFLENTANNEEK